MSKKEIFIYYISIVLFFILIYIIEPLIKNYIRSITVGSIILIIGGFYVAKQIKKLKIN